MIEILEEFISKLVADGREPPFHAAIIGAHGEFSMMRYEVTADGKILSEILAESKGDLATPLNLLLVDSKGEAARLAITGQPPGLVH